MIIAFDVDGTLVTYQDRPRHRVIDLLRWFSENGDRIYVWSGGGVEYAKHWVEKLGLDIYVGVEVISKTLESAKEHGIDLAIDDVPKASLVLLVFNLLISLSTMSLKTWREQELQCFPDNAVRLCYVRPIRDTEKERDTPATLS